MNPHRFMYFLLMHVSVLCTLSWTHKPKDRHQQAPEESWEGGKDAVGQIGHHKSRADHR